VEAATVEHNAEAKHRASVVTHRSSFARGTAAGGSGKKNGSFANGSGTARSAPPSPPSSKERQSSSAMKGGSGGRSSPENLELAKDVRQFGGGGSGGGTGGSNRSGGSGGSGRSKGQHVSFTEGLVVGEGSEAGGNGPKGAAHSSMRTGSAAVAATAPAGPESPSSLARTPAEMKLAVALRDDRNRAWDKVVKRINDNATEEAWDKVRA